jgi:hypothetical protein
MTEAVFEFVFRWLWPDRRTIVTEVSDGGLKYIRPSPITAKDLTSIARRVVQACYDNRGIWAGNTITALREVGLPETQAGLKDLLDSVV